MKIFRRLRALTWAGIQAGVRELDGARGFLRAARADWYMWLMAVVLPWIYGFSVMWFLYLCAIFGATCREWTLQGYKKMLDGYGTMVDQQQEIIDVYQNGQMHPSERAARDRLKGMN